MNMQATATLAKLDLESTKLCARCAALLFGQIAFCPYCGEDGTHSWNGAANVAPLLVESPSEVGTGAEPGAGSGSPELRLPEPDPLAPEMIAWAQPSALPGTAAPATGTGWSTGRTTALAVCIAAMALGAIHLYRTGGSDPHVASKMAEAPLAQAQLEPRPSPRPQGLPVSLAPTAAPTPKQAPPLGEPGDADCSDTLAALALCGKGLMPQAEPSRVGSR